MKAVKRRKLGEITNGHLNIPIDESSQTKNKFNMKESCKTGLRKTFINKTEHRRTKTPVFKQHKTTISYNK